MAEATALTLAFNPRAIWRLVHTRDSGLPVLLNVLTTTCIKPAKPELEPRGGTAVWVMGRQDPFYIRESVEALAAGLTEPEDSASIPPAA